MRRKTGQAARADRLTPALWIGSGPGSRRHRRLQYRLQYLYSFINSRGSRTLTVAAHAGTRRHSRAPPSHSTSLFLAPDLRTLEAYGSAAAGRGAGRRGALAQQARAVPPVLAAGASRSRQTPQTRLRRHRQAEGSGRRCMDSGGAGFDIWKGDCLSGAALPCPASADCGLLRLSTVEACTRRRCFSGRARPPPRPAALSRAPLALCMPRFTSRLTGRLMGTRKRLGRAALSTSPRPRTSRGMPSLLADLQCSCTRVDASHRGCSAAVKRAPSPHRPRPGPRRGPGPGVRPAATGRLSGGRWLSQWAGPAFPGTVSARRPRRPSRHPPFRRRPTRALPPLPPSRAPGRGTLSTTGVWAAAAV